jgi:selenoprotein W-related protein
VSLTAEVLKEYEFQIERLELIPGAGGVFEFAVDGELLYSKRETRRHAYAGEIMDLLRAKVGPPAQRPE